MRIGRTSIRATRRIEDSFAFGNGRIQALSPEYFHTKNSLKI